MPLLSADPYTLLVESETDAISLRQDVRLLGRKLGLGLIQQARITAAITTIARGFLSLEYCTEFHVRVADDAVLNALEVICVPRTGDAVLHQSQIERALHLGDTRMLVDETLLQVTPEGVRLRLRMWLVNVPCRGIEVMT